MIHPCISIVDKVLCTYSIGLKAKCHDKTKKYFENSTENCNALLMSKHVSLYKDYMYTAVLGSLTMNDCTVTVWDKLRIVYRGMSLSPINIRGLVYGLWEYNHSASLRGCFAIQMPESKGIAVWKRSKESNMSPH